MKEPFFLKIKRYIRVLARKLFEHQIKIYWNEVIISDEELLYSKGKVEHYAKEKIARRFAEQLMNDGMIDFESRKDYNKMYTVIRGKIRVI